MTTPSAEPGAPAASAARLAFVAAWRHAPANALRGIFDLLLEWQERARSRHHLQQIDDRLLADMGLTRDMVEAEIRKPVWRR